MTHGKKVMDIRPPVKFNKGEAMVHLLGYLGFAEHDQSCRFTSEMTRRMKMRSRGVGCSILVSAKPKETTASDSLHDPSEVLTFLSLLSKWGFESDSHEFQLLNVLRRCFCY
ncbi:probable trehalose-phosphate phosphatase 2 [Tanacetum coccineum]